MRGLPHSTVTIIIRVFKLISVLGLANCLLPSAIWWGRALEPDFNAPAAAGSAGGSAGFAIPPPQYLRSFGTFPTAGWSALPKVLDGGSNLAWVKPRSSDSMFYFTAVFFRFLSLSLAVVPSWTEALSIRDIILWSNRGFVTFVWFSIFICCYVMFNFECRCSSTELWLPVVWFG